MKKCFRCNQVKLLEDFHNHKGNPDGKFAWCKTCKCANAKQFRLKYGNKIRARDRAYDAMYPEKVKAVKKKMFAKKQRLGLCMLCSSPKHPHITKCLSHWVETNLKDFRKKLSPTERRILVQKLLNVLPTHCPYTQEPVYPGINLHLEHKLPVSKYPELEAGIDNLEWTSQVYNYAKWKMTTDEFNRHYTIIYIP